MTLTELQLEYYRKRMTSFAQRRSVYERKAELIEMALYIQSQRADILKDLPFELDNQMYNIVMLLKDTAEQLTDVTNKKIQDEHDEMEKEFIAQIKELKAEENCTYPDGCSCGKNELHEAKPQ